MASKTIELSKNTWELGSTAADWVVQNTHPSRKLKLWLGASAPSSDDEPHFLNPGEAFGKGGLSGDLHLSADTDMKVTVTESE